MMQSTCAVFRARNDLAPDIRNRIHNLHFCTSDRATPALIRPFMSRLLSRQFLAATYDGDLFSATPAIMTPLYLWPGFLVGEGLVRSRAARRAERSRSISVARIPGRGGTGAEPGGEKG